MGIYLNPGNRGFQTILYGNYDSISILTSSETYESLAAYIGMDYKGLKKDIIRMLGGEPVRVKISTFQNDMTSFKRKDDVLTLLIHLGYLSYDAVKKTVTIPNQEVADAFGDATDQEGWGEIGELIQESDDGSYCQEA